MANPFCGQDTFQVANDPKVRVLHSLEDGFLAEVREGGADDGVAARAAGPYLAGHAVHPAVPRAGPALLQLAPRLGGSWVELS